MDKNKKLEREIMIYPFMLCTPTAESVKASTIECVERARAAYLNESKYFPWVLTRGDGKARSRSIIASTMLRKWPEIPYLIFLDSDILFTVDDLKKLHSDLVAGYDLIGGVFAVRGGTQLSSYDGGDNGQVLLDGKIREFEYIASGFMGISQRLLQKMVDEIPLALLHPDTIKFYPFFEEKEFPNRDGESIFLSEDYEFCEKARKVGEKCYLDTSIQLGHIGEYDYRLADVLKYQRENNGKGQAKDLAKREKKASEIKKTEGEFVKVA